MLGAMAGALLGSQSRSSEVPIYPALPPCCSTPGLSSQHFVHAALQSLQPQICHYHISLCLFNLRVN